MALPLTLELLRNLDTFSPPCCFDSSTMTTPYIWFKYAGTENKVQLTDAIKDVTDLKKAIRVEQSPELDAYASNRLILKAKRSAEGDEQAMELGNAREPISSVHQRFDNDWEVLVSVPGK